MITVINAYWSGDSIVVVSRTPSGKRQSKAYPAEYSCFLKASAVTQEVESKLRRWPRIKRWHPEGEWIRLSWRSWADLKEATSRMRYPHPVHGGTESLFERMGLEVFEADVYPVRRWLTENDIEIQKPRCCYLDLETDSRVPFGRKEEARILSWAVVPDDGEWVGDVLSEDTDKAEREMLIELWEALDAHDQVCAWNGDRFDFEVLKARTKLHGLEVNHHGWLWLDHLELFKSMNMHVSESGDEKQSHALGRVATAVLGETKDDLDASKTWEYWEAGGESREKLFKYNVRDADLLRLIEAETGYIDLLPTICQVCSTLPDSRGNNGTNFVEGYLLKMGLKEGRRFRTNWDAAAYGEKFEGAFVMEPTRKGILHGVHVCDFAGMYPSIIQTWNISPETLRKDVVLQEDVDARPAYLKYMPLRTFPLPPDCCSVPGGSIFQSSPPGLVPRAIAELKSMRKFWSEKKSHSVPGTPEWHDSDRKSNAYKVCANTFYGVTGAPTSRFYAKELAGSVTAAGRWLILETIKAAEARGMSGVYTDTDSVFVMDVTETAFRTFTDWCNTDLYPSLLKELNCPVNEIKIAYEKEFSTLILVGKKRYAGRFAHYKGTRATDESKPEIKGLEYKRGDSVKLARDLQYEVVMMIMQGDENPDSYKAHIEAWKTRMLEGQLASRDFMLSKSLSMDARSYARKLKKDGQYAAQPIHVEVAHVLAKRGFDTGAGARIEYLVVDGSVSPLKAIPFIDYTEGVEDRFYLWSNLVWPPTERVLECAFPEIRWNALFGKCRPVKPRVGNPTGDRSPVSSSNRKQIPGQGSLFK